MKQFFKILALAALALPFTGCDVEYSDINILPDPVFEQNGLYTVNTISIYDDYETVIKPFEQETGIKVNCRSVERTGIGYRGGRNAARRIQRIVQHRL